VIHQISIVYIVLSHGLLRLFIMSFSSRFVTTPFTTLVMPHLCCLLWNYVTFTLLYHGAIRNEILCFTRLDCHRSSLHLRPEDSGCWHPLVATHPLRVLHFDGSSAAKFSQVQWTVTVKNQDVESQSDAFEEHKRLNHLCEWGKIDGFARKWEWILK